MKRSKPGGASCWWGKLREGAGELSSGKSPERSPPHNPPRQADSHKALPHQTQAHSPCNLGFFRFGVIMSKRKNIDDEEIDEEGEKFFNTVYDQAAPLDTSTRQPPTDHHGFFSYLQGNSPGQALTRPRSTSRPNFFDVYIPQGRSPRQPQFAASTSPRRNFPAPSNSGGVDVNSWMANSTFGGQEETDRPPEFPEDYPFEHAQAEDDVVGPGGENLPEGTALDVSNAIEQEVDEMPEQNPNDALQDDVAQSAPNDAYPPSSIPLPEQSETSGSGLPRQTATQEFGDDVGFDEEEEPSTSVPQEEQAADTMVLDTPEGISDLAKPLLSRVPDPTTEVPHNTQHSAQSTFRFGLALWAQKNSISRQCYKQLTEVLSTATDLRELHDLPARKETLLKNLKQTQPLLKLRKMTLRLDGEKLKTRSRLVEDMLVFDLRHMISVLLSSPSIKSQMYFGPAEKTDGRIDNAYKSRWWGESVRTSSGHFAALADGSGPIFPSDFIKYRCSDVEQQRLSAKAPCPCSMAKSEKLHFGRVVWSGYNDREGVDVGISLLVCPVFLRSELPDRIRSRSHQMKRTMLSPECTELVLTEGNEISVRPPQVVEIVRDVVLNYDFDPTRAASSWVVKPCAFIIRYIFSEDNHRIRPVRLSSPHRAELELRALGRKHVEQNFVGQNVLCLPWQLFVDGFGLYGNMYRSIMAFYLTGLFFTEEVRETNRGIFPLTLGPHGADLADMFRSLFHICDLDRGMEMEINGQKKFVCSFVQFITGDLPSQQKLSGCKSHNATKPCRDCFITNTERHNLDFDIVGFGRYHFAHIDNLSFAHSRPTQDQRRKAETQFGINADENLLLVLGRLFPALDLLKSRTFDPAHSELAGISRMLHSFLVERLLNPKAVDELQDVYQNFPRPPDWPHTQSLKHLESWRMHEYGRGAVLTPVILRSWLQPHHIKEHILPQLDKHAREFFDESESPIPMAHFKGQDWLVLAFWTFAQSTLAIFGRDITQRERDLLPKKIFAGRKAFHFICHVMAEAAVAEAYTARSRREANLKKASTRRPRRGKRAPPIHDAQDQGREDEQESVQSATPSELAASNDGLDDSPPGFAASSDLGGPASVVSDVGSLDSNGDSVVSETASVVVRRQNKEAKMRNPENAGKLFLLKKSLPNVHVAMHLIEDLHTYGTARLISTFRGETKHG